MSERRFTRLKASLSKETAAKTRETVSRELRQSLTSSNCGHESLFASRTVEPDYERDLRQWNEELRVELSNRKRCVEQANEKIDDEHEQVAEHVEDRLPDTDSIDLDLLNCFTVQDDDIECIEEEKSSHLFDFNRYYPSNQNPRPSSPFAHECILYYTDRRHLVRWKSMDRHFGTVFDTCATASSFLHCSTNSSSTSGKCRQSSENLISNGNVANSSTCSSLQNGANSFFACNSSKRKIRPHLFECDLESQQQQNINLSRTSHFPSSTTTFRISTQNRLIREGSASVISLESDALDPVVLKNARSSNGSTNISGWLTLSKDESNCFLTFYDCARRDKILWHIEVNRKVSKLVEPPSSTVDDLQESVQEDGNSSSSSTTEKCCPADITRSCFRVTKHLIFTDRRYIEDWIKDINSNIGEEFNANKELARILSGDHTQISTRLKNRSLLAGVNLFSAYSLDLTHRMGTYPAMKNSVHRIGFQNPKSQYCLSYGSNLYFRFMLSIRGFDVQSSDRNKSSTSITTSSSSSTAANGAMHSTSNLSANYQCGDSFFLRIALFDAKHGKISEEFRFTASSDIKALRPSAKAEQNRDFDQRILCTASRAQFTLDLAQSSPADVYLVLRIERTSHRLLNYCCTNTGCSSASTSSPYYASNSSNNNNNNNNKMAAPGIIASHVEPYAWSLRPLFQDNSAFGTTTTATPSLETATNFGIFFKLDQNRISDEFVINSLRNLQNSDKQNSSHSGGRSQTALNARLEIELQDLNEPSMIANAANIANGSHPLHHAVNPRHGSGEMAGVTGNTPAFAAPEVTLSPSLFLVNSSTANKATWPTSGAVCQSPILQIQPLRLPTLPFAEYFNLLYIYPQSLKFDSQKVFSKARNLCVTVEIRDSDEIDGVSGLCQRSLPVIFGRPHDQSLFVRSATTAVSRHHVTPEFFEEIKVALPLHFSDKLHILFTFAHVSCKKDACTYSTVGYSWLPISPDSSFRNRNCNPIHTFNQQLSVFASLPNCYLSCQSLGLGKGLSMPDVKFVGKDLFRVSTILISSVASRDADIQQTLSSVIKITRSTRDDSKEISQIISLERNLPKLLRHLPDCDRPQLIHFSPLILQQLLKLLVFAANQDLILESFRTILHLVDKFRKTDQLPLLNEFIEQVFCTSEFCGVHVHDQLIVLLNRMLADFSKNDNNQTGLTAGKAFSTASLGAGSLSSTTTSGNGATSISACDSHLKILLHNLWFILRIMTKSMIQYLAQSGRSTLTREDRFEPEFVDNLKRFIENTSTLIATFSRSEEAPAANQALAHFLTRLCSFFDRSVVFNALHAHVCALSASRDIVVQELKLNAIAIFLAHEHFVAYCNPLIDTDIVSTSLNCTSDSSCQSPTGLNWYALSAQFARTHFPIYLALGEFKSSYSHRSNTSTLRPIALYIVRNQLAKHFLLDRSPNVGEPVHQRMLHQIVTLYLPILSIILDNTNRLVDSTIAAKDGNCTFGGSLAFAHYGVPSNGGSTGAYGGGSSSRPGTSGSGKKSASPYSTINEVPNILADLSAGPTAAASGAYLTRSTSEISSNSCFSVPSTISSVSSYGSLSSAASTLTNASIPTLTGSSAHQRTNSMVLSSAQLATVTAPSSSLRDKFSPDEVRDLFVCLLAVVQVLDTDKMNQLGSKQLKDLFLCLECALNSFEYKPAATKFNSNDSKSKTLPSYLSGLSQLQEQSSASNTTTASSSTSDMLQHYLLSQNLSIQCASITLRTIHLYLDNDEKPIDTSIIAQILSIYLTLMSLPQAQTILVDVFDSIRYFVQKFALLLFNSEAFLSPIIGKVIKYCNSSLSATRQGATDLLYCLLSTNLKRTRFETIVCVSRLASSDPHGLLYLQSSLNRIEFLATVDSRDHSASQMLADSALPSLGSTNLPDSSLGTHEGEEGEEISILHIVGRIREILKATKQIREESFDPYLASELRLQLANSYARTSRSLLRTWLENLAEVHVRNRDWAEAAMCYSQVIAILVEQLASKEIDVLDGMLNICKVSPDNIFARESIKQESDWLELEESHVSIEVLEKMTHETVDLLERAELYELAPHVLKVMVCSYEREYEHKKLAEQYQKMAKIHSKVQEINDSGKRLFDTFFRIAFYHNGPYATSHKTEFIYKLAKVVSLAEMTGMMQALYPEATFLSADPETNHFFMPAPCSAQSNQTVPTSVSSKQDQQSCESSKSAALSIVITHVTPYVQGARNQFEKSVGVSQFVYEQRLGGKIAQSVSEQFKRRVILTVANSFPYFLKRIPVADRREVILSPIEVAIDEMQERVHQLEHVINSRDAKHLQLVLQGSVNATVNAGPIAYANAFLRTPTGPELDDLDDEANSGADTSIVSMPFQSGDVLDNSTGTSTVVAFSEAQKHLKFVFEQFLDLCESALKLNEKLIKPNQVEYHHNLKANFEKLRDELDFFHDRPTSLQIFDVISGSTFA